MNTILLYRKEGEQPLVMSLIAGLSEVKSNTTYRLSVSVPKSGKSAAIITKPSREGNLPNNFVIVEIPRSSGQTIMEVLIDSNKLTAESFSWTRSQWAERAIAVKEPMEVEITVNGRPEITTVMTWEMNLK